MDANEEAARRAMVAFGEECKRTQLQNMLSALSEAQRRRFLPAVEQAGAMLEWLSPAIMAPLPTGNSWAPKF